MPNYENGKIYSIRSHSRPDLIYVGSTTQQLSVRFGEHKRQKRTTSRQIIDLGDSYIELVENYRCENREELLKKEGEIIRSMDCVNKQIAGRTVKEWIEDNADKIKEYHKQYRKDNDVKIKKYQKQYQTVNIDELKEQKKQYQKVNADKIKEYQNQYRENNVDKKNKQDKQYRQDNAEKLKQKLECECGGKYTHGTKSIHFKTKKHKLYQETLLI
jgi:hypothetical protein